MKRIRSMLIVAFLLATILMSACGSVPKVDWTLKISGSVASPLEISYAGLVKMPQTELTDIMMDKSIGEDEITSWSGVALDYLLEQAGVAEGYDTITAIATDGYAIEITKDELAGAIVALKEGEEWIQKADAEHGPIRLVCPQTPANRWVYQLQELQVNQ